MSKKLKWKEHKNNKKYRTDSVGIVSAYAASNGKPKDLQASGYTNVQTGKVFERNNIVFNFKSSSSVQKK